MELVRHTISGFCGKIDKARVSVNGEVLAINLSVLNPMVGRAVAMNDAMIFTEKGEWQ